MIGYIYLTLAVFGTSVGQLLLKQYNMQSKKITFGLLAALLLLVSVPLFKYLSLQYISFAIVFLIDAIVIALIVLLSKIVLNEYIRKKKILGIAFVILGILMIDRSLV